MTAFYRDLDRERFGMADAEGKGHYLKMERNRIHIAGPQSNPTDIGRRFPPNATIDWFEPAYFNNLPISLRHKYCHNGIAFPLRAHWAENWQGLTDEEFMEKYGNAVLALYNIPTDADVDDDDSQEVEDMVA
jgi:hypothetical protein